jgi:hypothetical protein
LNFAVLSFFFFLTKYERRREDNGEGKGKTKFFETAGYRSQMYIKQMPIDDDIFVII